MPTQQTDPVEHEQQESEQRQQNKGREGGGERKRETLDSRTQAKEGLIILSQSPYRQNITDLELHLHVFIYPFSRRSQPKQFKTNSAAVTEPSRLKLTASLRDSLSSLTFIHTSFL